MSRKLVLAALLMLVAGSLSGPALAASLHQASQGIDAEMAAFAEMFPGFGGFYYDQQGRPNVYLKDLSQASVFLQLGDDVQIHQGEYDFRDLQSWRLRARPNVLGIQGVVTLDVDETSNRIKIGIDPAAGAAAIAEVESALAYSLVPEAAVIFSKADPIYRAATLRDSFRPVPGGVQIHFSNFLCTLGFNASRGGVSGHVNNSHCTDRQGGVESTRYFQPLSPNAISTEIADPDYFRRSNGCPKGSKCRFSDSSFAAYDSASLSGGNIVARPTSRGQFNGSLTIDSGNPTFNVTGFSNGSTPVGTEVNKVGRTTGWTFGPVTDSCVDVGVSGSNIVQLCQDIVTGGVGGGDSGSPVFTWGGGSNVTIVGILWGGNSAGTLFVFSPYFSIKSELGLN